MEESLIVAASVFAIVSTVTPGPNNLMLAASGLSFGFRRTVPMMLGFLCGLLVLLLGVASGLGAVFQQAPFLHTALKVFGGAYLLYLAWKLWRLSMSGSTDSTEPLSFFRGVAFQAVNPKAWMMTVGAVSAYTLPGPGYWPSVWMLVAAFLFLGLPSVALWAAFGGAFRTSFGDRRHARWIARSMAVLTAISCLLIVI